MCGQGGAITFHSENSSGPPGLKLTKAGGLYILLTLLLGFSAVNTGNNLLFLIVSALLGFMSVSGIMGWLNITRLSIGLDLPEEVYAGVPFPCRLRVINRKRILPSLLLRLAAGKGAGVVVIVPRGGPGGCSMPMEFPARGEAALPEVTVSSPFPINFFIRHRKVRFAGSCTVFPHPIEAVPPAGDGSEGVDDGSPGGGGYEGDLEKISDYTGSEPLKMIHWRLSARHGEYKVKHLSAPSAEPVTLDLSRMQGGVEERISHAAWLVNRLIRDRGVPVGLRMGERIIEPGLGHAHRLKLLSELAVHGLH